MAAKKKKAVLKAAPKKVAPKSAAPKTRTRHARWIEAAMLLPSTANPLSVPYEVFIKEATDAAKFIKTYWKATKALPGLARVRNKMPLSTSAEITELVAAVQQAQTDATLAVTASAEDPTVRADEIIAELSAALAFTLDDGVEDDDDTRYAKVRAFHAKRESTETSIGQDLLNHATLASTLRERLVHDDEEFNPSLIDEGLRLTARLSAASVAPPAEVSPPPADEAPSSPLALRNRLLTLLVQRVAQVRRAARRVFAKHPDILAEVTSAHERERRAEARSKQPAKGEPTTPDAKNKTPAPVG